MKKLFEQYKPSLVFLGKFLGLYIVLTVVYNQVYLNSFGLDVDPMSAFVARQSCGVMDMAGMQARSQTYPNIQRADILIDQTPAVSVIEGCNGIAVMILFASFIVAFHGDTRKKAWFIPLGVLFIHIVNLFRISLLSYTAINNKMNLYVVEKRLFSAIIYTAVFLLWFVWVSKLSKSSKTSA